MEFLSIIWDDGPDGNLEHITEHGLTPDDVEEILENPIEKTVSDSSGAPLYKGFALDGRLCAVVFERSDAFTATPVTAYPIERD